MRFIISFSFIFLTGSLNLNAQERYCITFENEDSIYFHDDWFNDNFFFQNGLGDWQIGEVNKSIFTDAYSGTQSVCTNLSHNYTPTDTSYFSFNGSLGGCWVGYDIFKLEFKHRFQMDSSSHGKISFWRIQNQQTTTLVDSTCLTSTNSNFNQYHIDLATMDSTSDCLTLKGSSNGWMLSSIDLSTYAFNNLFQIKFSFFSSNNNLQNGWQIDDICIEYDCGVNTEEISPNQITLSPNPTNQHLNIQSQLNVKQITIYNVNGQKAIQLVSTNQLNVSTLKAGRYIAQIELTDGSISSQHFVKQ